MTQTAIPFLLMRGGSSRGPYFHRDDLPKDRETLAEALMAVMGCGDDLNIDGVGGGSMLTTKAAMLSPSEDDGADVDFFFAQLSVRERRVDFKPTCGNILSGVGPAAIEMGLVKPRGDVTEIRIRAVNTGADVLARVQTPGGALTYEGETEIPGVPGRAAPVELHFMNVAGSATGALLPTGNLRDIIGGIECTCMDVAVPIVITRAADFGLTGYESPAALNAAPEFLARIEAIRLEAGQRMGMGDVSASVTPKFTMLAPPREGGAMSVRYFMPWQAHPSLAVTGSQCLAACALAQGSVSDGVAQRPGESPARVALEHPSGAMEVLVDYETAGGLAIRSTGLLRTARKLAEGRVFIPSHIWDGRRG